MERKLTVAGIACKYANQEVVGKHFVIYFAGSSASNGESVAWLVLRFNESAQPESGRKSPGDIDYTDFHTRDIAGQKEGGYDAGVRRVKENYEQEHTFNSYGGNGTTSAGTSSIDAR